jgi:hypothetical protein
VHLFPSHRESGSLLHTFRPKHSSDLRSIEFRNGQATVTVITFASHEMPAKWHMSVTVITYALERFRASKNRALLWRGYRET